MADLAGKAAIVTGSSSGIGQAVAIALGKRGCSVVVNYTKSVDGANETKRLIEEAGGKAVICAADVGNDADCRRLAQTCVDAFGAIHFLVNNAGFTKFVAHDDLEGLSPEDFLDIYKINVVGAYTMTRACAPEMKKHGKGSVVNISSLAGVMGIGSCVAYAASKGALNTMTLSLARALGPEIRVNAVCPGFIQGRWLENGMGTERYNEYKNRIETTGALRATSTPEAVAEPVMFFLASGSLVTGEVLMIDGGWHLGPAPPKRA